MVHRAIIERFRANENLPSLPGVAVEVLALTEQPDCTIDQLANVIQNDPAITARILKIINSPLFGVAKGITSIKQASTLLGMRKLRIMALSFSIVQAIRRPEGDETFDYEAYWRQALTAAVASRLLATKTARPLAEDAFVAGLLHNIGTVAGYLTAPDLFQPLLKRGKATGRWSVDDEIELLGATHATLSAELLKVWGLPEALRVGVESYRDAAPLKTTGSTTPGLAHLIAAGVSIAELFGGDASVADIEFCRARCMQLTGIDRELLEQVLDAVATRVQEIAGMLVVKIGPTLTYEQIQRQAEEQLSQAIASPTGEVPRPRSRGKAA